MLYCYSVIYAKFRLNVYTIKCFFFYIKIIRLILMLLYFQWHVINKLRADKEHNLNDKNQTIRKWTPVFWISLSNRWQNESLKIYFKKGVKDLKFKSKFCFLNEKYQIANAFFMTLPCNQLFVLVNPILAVCYNKKANVVVLENLRVHRHIRSTICSKELRKYQKYIYELVVHDMSGVSLLISSHF